MQTPEISQVVFLAGGRGSRISNLTTDYQLPKQLLSINGTSSLEHGLKIASEVIPYSQKLIISFPAWEDIFKTRFPDCLVITQQRPLGNADALRLAVCPLNYSLNLLCLNADHLFGLSRFELENLINRHTTGNFDVTVLLEKNSGSQNPQFVWSHDDSNNLTGRNKGESKSKDGGYFIGIFLAKISWLCQNTILECKVAKKVKTEAKTTEMILREIGKAKVGVYVSPSGHYGINTNNDYERLCSKLN